MADLFAAKVGCQPHRSQIEVQNGIRLRQQAGGFWSGPAAQVDCRSQKNHNGNHNDRYCQTSLVGSAHVFMDIYTEKYGPSPMRARLYGYTAVSRNPPGSRKWHQAVNSVKYCKSEDCARYLGCVNL